MTNIAIFVSGGGTNCENIIRYFSTRDTAKVVLVISNRADAYALTRADRLGVPHHVLAKRQLNDPDTLLPLLERYDVNFIVLAGFLLMAPDYLVDRFNRRMVNIHPALLPKHGGKGMYGRHVHEAVKADGDTVTGITIHYVSRECDAGEIIFQATTPVSADDTPDDIAAHIHVLEQRWFPEIIERVITHT